MIPFVRHPKNGKAYRNKKIDQLFAEIGSEELVCLTRDTVFFFVGGSDGTFLSGRGSYRIVYICKLQNCTLKGMNLSM